MAGPIVIKFLAPLSVESVEGESIEVNRESIDVIRESVESQ